MKAVLFDDYGPFSVLRYGDAPDPVAGPGEALVRVAAASVNPIDVKIRSGAVRDRMPVALPSIPGVDVAGEVVAIGSGVTTLKVGDHIMGMAKATYAELCVVGAADTALVPDGMDPTDAAALPLVTGALGAVGRAAVSRRPI